MVVAGFLAVVSLIQYASKQATYQQARSRDSIDGRVAPLPCHISQIDASHTQCSDLCHGSLRNVTTVLAAGLLCECNSSPVGIAVRGPA